MQVCKKEVVLGAKLEVALDKSSYAELCKMEYICLYNQAWFMDTVCGDPKNWDVLVCKKGREIVGALPFFVKKKYGFSYITLPYRVQHNSVWIRINPKQTHGKKVSYENEVMACLIAALEQEVQKRKIYSYRQSFSPDITNWMPFYWGGFKQSTKYTYRIADISNEQEVMKGFFNDKRGKVKKAQKVGLKLGFDLSAAEFYKFHRRCLAEEGKQIKYSFEVFEHIYHALYRHKAGRILYASDKNGNLVDAMFSGYDEKWGYNWWHAISADGKQYGASDWLVFEMIKHLASIGVRGYDFEGSMIPGVEESFRHYGGVQTPYFTISKNYAKNPLLGILIDRRQ